MKVVYYVHAYQPHLKSCLKGKNTSSPRNGRFIGAELRIFTGSPLVSPLIRIVHFLVPSNDDPYK